MKDKPKLKRRSISGLGWSGLWMDGTLGWCISYFVDKYPQSLNESQREVLGHDVPRPQGWGPGNMYRVKITVQLVRDKNGRPIMKRGKP